MIDWYNSSQNSDNLGKHSRMLLREGLISKVTLTLRSRMRKLFRVPRSNKKRVYRARSLELPILLRPATKLADGIELENFRIETISTNVNWTPLQISRRNLCSFSGKHLEGSDLDAVDGLQQDEHYDDRIHFILSKLDELEARHCSGKSAGLKKFIQKLYIEDLKRALDWWWHARMHASSRWIRWCLWFLPGRCCCFGSRPWWLLRFWVKK